MVVSGIIILWGTVKLGFIGSVKSAVLAVAAFLRDPTGLVSFVQKILRNDQALCDDVIPNRSADDLFEVLIQIGFADIKMPADFRE